MPTIEQLNKKLEQATDPDEYDLITQQIAEQRKAVSLERARMVQEEEERKRRELEDAEKRYALLRDKIAKQKKDLAAKDDGLLDALEELLSKWEEISGTFEEHISTISQANTLARKFDFEAVAKPAPTLSFGVNLTFSEVLTRFTEHRAQLRKERASGKPVPKRVTAGMMRAHIIRISKDGKLIDNKGRQL